MYGIQCAICRDWCIGVEYVVGNGGSDDWFELKDTGTGATGFVPRNYVEISHWADESLGWMPRMTLCLETAHVSVFGRATEIACKMLQIIIIFYCIVLIMLSCSSTSAELWCSHNRCYSARVTNGHNLNHCASTFITPQFCAGAVCA